MKEKWNKKKTIKLIVSILVVCLIITAITLIVIGFLPKDSSGHICSGDSCTIPV